MVGSATRAIVRPAQAASSEPVRGTSSGRTRNTRRSDDTAETVANKVEAHFPVGPHRALQEAQQTVRTAFTESQRPAFHRPEREHAERRDQAAQAGSTEVSELFLGQRCLIRGFGIERFSIVAWGGAHPAVAEPELRVDPRVSIHHGGGQVVRCWIIIR